jgi:hypothetical protein
VTQRLCNWSEDSRAPPEEADGLVSSIFDLLTFATLLVPFLGPWSRLFGFVPLSPLEMGTVVGIVTAYLAATETTKRWFFRASGATDG